MKVLQINAVNKVASTGRTCCEMSNYLIEHGDTCVTAYSKGVSVDKNAEYVIGNAYDVKLHGLFSRLSGKQAYFSKRETGKLLRFTKEFEPDIVILRNLHGNYINLPMLFSFLAENDIATVAVLHDCWFFTGKCCHYTSSGCYKWQTECRDCPSLKKYNKSWFFDRSAEMFRDKERLFNSIPRLAVVGVSQWLTNEAKKAPIFKNAREIIKIYNWIDTDVFKPVDVYDLREQLGLGGKKMILAAASGWSREKGLETVIELSKKLSDSERIVMVGNINANVTLPDKIISMPATNSVEELVKYYSATDVFLQPSLEETFGKVTAEALSCGTPVVCFNSTANPELVGKDCGAVVPVNDISKMLSEIRTVLSNGKSAYSEKCRDFAVQSFNMEKNISQYYALFQRLSNKQ
ncbi:MAG: glycosyltransferase [Oscillospiraceae bacterium]|nr:glycosyltransferase [Oscillospiraceae bacterium]